MSLPETKKSCLGLNRLRYGRLQRLARRRPDELVIPALVQRAPLRPDAPQRVEGSVRHALLPGLVLGALQLRERRVRHVPLGAARLALVLGEDLLGRGGEGVDDQRAVGRGFWVLGCGDEELADAVA